MPAVAALKAEDWRRLNRLLSDALVLEADARSTWLRSVPAADSDLLPLLQRLLSAQDLTETAQFAAPLPPSAVDDAPVAQEQPGQLIGPYRLLRELGQGGMGTVWLAERADGAFERQVALKLPHAEWIDRGLAQRFARERAVLASLNHPNIAQLFDAGWSESGRPYLALEYVEGEPIHQSCNQKHLDTRARLSLFVAVIRAVAHAHARLVVHRDLKPTNVLVTAAGEVKLLDFGIAKLLVAENVAADETELTRMAGRALTLSYAAPEQILGQPISTAADIYALGVMLFELLTGERPYRLARADAQGRSALEEAIVHIDPPAPSAVAKDTTLRHTLRGDLDAIVLKALKEAPEQRYETAAAFADDIERYLNRLPVRAQRASRAYRLRRFLVRNRFTVGAVGAVMVALTVGLSVALWQATVARDEAARATTIKDFVLSIIQQADPVASRQTREADVALLTTAESRIERELESEPELALQMRRAIGAAYRNRGEYRRATLVLRKGIEQARIALPPDNLELLGAMVQIAEEYVVDTRKAREDLETAIVYLRALGPTARPLLADALLGLHQIKRWNTHWKEQLASGEEAYRAAKATDDDGRILIAAAELTDSHLNIHRPGAKDALPIITEAYEGAMRRGRIEPSDPRRIRALSFRAIALSDAGQTAEALKLAQQAVDDARKYHGLNAHITEVTLTNLYFAQWFAGDPKAALPPMREAYDIAVKREPSGSGNCVHKTMLLTHLLLGLGMREEAERVMQESPPPPLKLIPGSPAHAATETPVHYHLYEAEVRLRMGDTESAARLAEEAVPPMQAEGAELLASRLYSVLARSLLENGKPERAEAFAAASIEHYGTEFVPKALGHASLLLLLSRIHLELAKYQSALELAVQALALYSEKSAPNANAVAQVDFRRGRALLGLGRHNEAVEALSAAHAHWQKSAPGGEATALMSYWYGRALIANGESARGQTLIAGASPQLAASRSPLTRALVADGGTFATNQK